MMPTFDPYQPPAQALEPPAPTLDDVLEAPPPTMLGHVVLIALAACGFFAVLSLFTGSEQLALLERAADPGISTAEAEANALRVGAVAILRLVAFLITAVLFSVWLVRATRTARAIAPDLVTITPGWAVGWYLIPCANLWKPYQAMKELWSASAATDAREDWRTPIQLPLWWAAWICSGFLDRIASRPMKDDASIPQMISGTRLEIASSAFEVLLCALAGVVVWTIVRLQARFSAA